MARKPGRPKKRRSSTQHPGVKILARVLPSGSEVFIGRYRDPVTGAVKQESLTALGKTTAEARRDWAIDKYKYILRVKEAQSTGKPIRTETTVEAAVNDYIASLDRKRPKTITIYTRALDHFKTWARKAHLTQIEDLTGPHLVRLSAYLHGLRVQRSVKGEGVGRKARQNTKQPLAPASVNQFTRGIRTFLRHCRRLDLTPHLTGDMVQDRLPFAERVQELPRFLSATEIRALLDAAERHDAATYTRHRWRAGRNYPAIRPFIVTALLSGARFAEIAGLKWADVDLTQGQIRIAAGSSKTRKGRVIDLGVSPALWALLERMKLQAGNAATVFGPMRRDVAEACRRRVCMTFGAPAGWTWHDLRRTCGTFLTCAPGIFGGASAFMSAKRLGHSVAVAESCYVGAVSNIPVDASTLEAAMGIADLLPRREVKPEAKIG